jgi:hypothetical protein
MNIIYYAVGSFVTFIGIIIYRFFAGSGVVVLNNTTIIEYGITALIAGVSFFVADYLMSKAKS